MVEMYLCKDCRKMFASKVLSCPYCGSKNYGYVSPSRHKDMVSGRDGIIKNNDPEQ